MRLKFPCVNRTPPRIKETGRGRVARPLEEEIGGTIGVEEGSALNLPAPQVEESSLTGISRMKREEREALEMAKKWKRPLQLHFQLPELQVEVFDPK